MNPTSMPDAYVATDPISLFNGSRGLLVEDSAYGAGLARSLMRRGAANVVVAASVPAAQGIVRAQPIDWALIDTRLSGAGTGVDLAGWLRETYPHIVRISHAAFAPIGAVEGMDGIAAPLFHALVPKPATATAIVEAIEEALEAVEEVHAQTL